MQQFAKTKFFKVIISAAFLVALIFINPNNFFNPVRLVSASIFLPFQKVFYSISMGVANVGEFFGSIGQLKDENKRLLSENQQLLAKNAMFADIENENKVLREQLDLLPRDKYNLIAASVVSQDPHTAGNWLEIDKGSNDGVIEGMSVIVSKGIFVGRVQEVSGNSCKVVLLTNSKSTINAMTSENSSKGVIRGEYGLGLILDMILQTDDVQIGNNIITSGTGGAIPRGLFIGTVQEVRDSDDHLFQQAIVASPLQVSKLQVVFIVKEIKSVTADLAK